MAARNGTFAALLAQAGMTGPPKILEGKFGYGNMVAGFLEEAVLRHRSGDFEILKSCVKLWPCLVTAQAPIDAALAIRHQGVVPGEIESIAVALSGFAYQQQNRLAGEIRTRESADHSIAYIVARALLDGEVRSDHFEKEYFLDSEALALVGRMSFQPDVRLTALYPESLGARVELKLVTGRVFEAEVLYPEGHAKSPADDERLTRKFIGLAENLGKERIHRVIENVLSIEKNSDLVSLLELIGR
jgi:2-methylcitrate dehydratase